MLQFPGWHMTLTAPFYGLQTLLHNWQLKLGVCPHCIFGQAVKWPMSLTFVPAEEAI